jgi:RNA polymerase sigma-70 factor (ECF subfamily)
MSDGRAQGDITVLVGEHYEFLYRFAYRLSGSSQDAEDLAQQTFLAAQRNSGQLREAEKARAWLTAILRNLWRKSIRRPASGKPLPLESVLEPADDPSEDFPLDAEELQGALNRLPEEYRAAIVLYYLEDMSYRDIAAALEVPIGTVMSRLSRGKAALRKLLRVEEAVDVNLE